MKADNETVLLKGLARNDRKCIEAIYRDNYNAIQSLIIKNNGSIDDAKDIFQEAILVLYEKVQSDEFILSCQIKTYIYSVSRRLWLKRLVQQNRFLVMDDGEHDVVSVEEEIEELTGLVAD